MNITELELLANILIFASCKHAFFTLQRPLVIFITHALQLNKKNTFDY